MVAALLCLHPHLPACSPAAYTHTRQDSKYTQQALLEENSTLTRLTEEKRLLEKTLMYYRAATAVEGVFGRGGSGGGDSGSSSSGSSGASGSPGSGGGSPGSDAGGSGSSASAKPSEAPQPPAGGPD
jgi:hypothetical protein